MTVDELLCEWATARYNLEDVKKVEFEYADAWRYSEMTPGESAGLLVTIKYGKSGRKVHTDRDSFDGELIREILSFALLP